MGSPLAVRPRVVFDTSVVVPILALQSSQLSWLLAHWRDGGCIPLISGETTRELMRVLHYRKFHLTGEEVEQLLADYLPFCEIVAVRKPCPVLCRDANDQPFLDLAHGGRADSLVTGDSDLLALAGKTKFRIETPAAYRLRIDGV